MGISYKKRVLHVVALLVFLFSTLTNIQIVHAANATLDINGSQVFQTIDGFGVNANSASWNSGELIPAIDSLIDQNGSRIWRVVIDDQDWEATNDDSDPNTYNWTIYNAIYSSAKFEKLWAMIGYLNSRGITNNVIICPMGKAANWMGGFSLTNTSTIKNEYAEMITSMAIYGHNARGLQFTLEPNNEPDINTEGVYMQAPVQAEVLNNIAQRLDAVGLTTMRMMGPSAGVINYAVNDFTEAMMAYPALMSHVDIYSYHDYNGSTANAANVISSSAYPNKKFYMTEFSQFADGMSMLGQGTQGMLVWDGYDSVYNHPLDRGGSTNAPNDAGDGPALLSYDSSSHTYSPRKEFYQFSQLFRFIPAGSVRIGATNSNSSITTYAFKDAVSSRLTIVGNNTTASSQTLAISLSNVGVPPAAFSYYQTNATSNMSQGADVSVSNGTATVTIPANTIFTLTGLGTQDTQAPEAPTNLSGTSLSPTSCALTWIASTDNIGIAGYTVLRNGVAVGQPVAPSFTDNGLTADTTYTYTVQARDTAGNVSAVSNSIVITTPIAPPDTTSPTVSITSPSSGATVSGTVAITAIASDDTQVVGVQFKLDGTNVGAEDLQTPYSVDWNTLPTSAGAHTLTAVARDAAGNTTTATNVNVVVNNSAGIVLLGNQNIQTNTDSDPAGTAEAFKFTAVANGVAGALKLYISTGTTATSVKAGIYSNNNNHPGTLLTSGSISSPVSASWNTITLNPGTNLTAGTVYWIGFLGTGGQLSYKDATTGNCSESPSGSNLSALPATWTTGTSWSSCNASVYVVTSGVSDTTPPTTPQNLTANAVSMTRVDLAWGASTDTTGVTNYIVKRNGSTIAQPTGVTYSDTTVVANTTYTYTVYAVDAAGNQSAVSNTATVTTPTPPPDTTAPTTPLNLQLTSVGYTNAIISWSAAADNIGVTGYQILRDSVVIATTTATTYTDNSLTAGTTYTYNVKAFDAANNSSAASAPLTVTTNTPDTSAPAIALTSPVGGSTLSGTVAVSATASDNIGVVGVQFKVDGSNVGTEDTTAPYSINWDTTSVSNGAHIITAIARDAAGNSTTASSLNIVVTNVTPTIAVDKTVTTNQTSASSTISSPSFTTSQSNELLVAFITSDGPSGTAQSFKTVTGGGLTWTLRKRVNTRAGTSEIWTAYATTVLSNAVVLATRNSGSYVGSITVVTFIGASSTPGATGGNNAATGAPTVNLTTTKTGSLVWGVGNDWDGASARTAGTSQTIVNQYLASVGDTFWVQRANNATTSVGQVITLNDSAPTNHRWNFASIEITPL